MVAENTRQDDLQRQAIASLKGTQEQFTPEFQNEGIEAAAAERIERLQGAVVGSGETEAVVADLPFAGSAPDIVRETAAKRLSEGLAEGKGFAKRLGRFGAFGEQNFQNRLDMNRLGERMGMIGGESRNSAQLLPFELDAANRAGDTMSGFADILGSLGSVAGLGSAVGANPFGGFGALTGTSIIPDFLRGMPPIPGSKPILPIPFEGPLQF
jgi:hypothetical protein